jgi:hypothetical protein
MKTVLFFIDLSASSVLTGRVNTDARATFCLPCLPPTKSPGIRALSESGYLQEILRVSGQDEPESTAYVER